MILSLAVIVFTGMIAYIWSARGFFSAFMHMLCVIAAGALAFAVWEPLALWILANDPTQGGTFVDLAWGLALAMPFAIILTILRVACDKLVPFNLKFDGGVNIAGGLVCGAISGIIAAGILTLSVSFMRLDTEFLGYRPVLYGNGGTLERKSSLYLPADRLTAWFYSTLSNSTLVPPGSDSENRPYSLGRMHPELADEGWLLRTSFEDGKAKNTLPPSAFEVLARYNYTSDKDPGALLGDGFPPQRKVTFSYLNGDNASPGSTYIEGFVVRFKSGAKEQSGRIVVGPAQMSLVVQKDPNDPFSTMGINPIGMNSQAQGDKPNLGRWRFDAPNVFISSVGGRDDAPMSFEFPVPKGAKAIALYVKGVRYDVTDMPPGRTYTSQSARDAAITDGSINPTGQQAKIDWSRAVKVKPDTSGLIDSTIRVAPNLPFNIMLQKDIVKDILIDEENKIIGGSMSKFHKDELSRVGDDRHLQVRQFGTAEDTQIVAVVMDGKNKQFGFLSDVAADMDRAGTPLLVDSQGQQYSPRGYVYRGAGEIWVYYNPQSPINTTTDKEMPQLTRSQPDQELVLIFAVSKNVKLRGFAVGDKGLAEFAPQIDVK